MVNGTPSAGRPGLYEASDFYLACFLRCAGPSSPLTLGTGSPDRACERNGVLS